MANMKQETMSRTAFYNLRPEYEAFPKTVIDGKVGDSLNL
jgi:hypothetical protein